MRVILAFPLMALVMVLQQVEGQRQRGGRILLTYLPMNTNDPEGVAALHEALTKVGLNPNGIEILEIYKKQEIVRVSYKATYRTEDGQVCFLKWRKVPLLNWGPAMPSCTSARETDGKDSPPSEEEEEVVQERRGCSVCETRCVVCQTECDDCD